MKQMFVYFLLPIFRELKRFVSVETLMIDQGCEKNFIVSK